LAQVSGPVAMEIETALHPVSSPGASL
jgi:hypothetical protein